MILRLTMSSPGAITPYTLLSSVQYKFIGLMLDTIALLLEVISFGGSVKWIR